MSKTATEVMVQVGSEALEAEEAKAKIAEAREQKFLGTPEKAVEALTRVRTAVKDDKDAMRYWFLFKKHRGFKLLFSAKSMEAWLEEQGIKKAERVKVRNRIDYLAACYRRFVLKDTGNGEKATDEEKAIARGKALANVKDQYRTRGLEALVKNLSQSDLVSLAMMCRDRIDEIEHAADEAAEPYEPSEPETAETATAAAA